MEYTEPTLQQSVCFGPFRFEPLSGRLWSGKEELRLTPKAAAVLSALVARRGEPVSKETLFATVWPNAVVSDSALSTCVQELRKALDDDPKVPRFIETRHRRGYRFIANLAATTDQSTAGALAAASQANGKPTIAVLPFDNISGDAAQEYFSDGITEDIITVLSKHRSLLVTARGATIAFKGHGIDARHVEGLRKAGVQSGASNERRRERS